MAVKIEGILAKLIKPTKVKIVAVIDDSSSRNDVLKVTMSEAYEATASKALPNGAPMKVKSEVFSVGASDIKAFTEGLKDNEDGTFTYEGNLKFDVSAPRFNDDGSVRKPAALWLTSTAFSKLNGINREEKSKKDENALLRLFAQPVTETEKAKAEAVLSTENEPE
jgi:hypothetical protein